MGFKPRPPRKYRTKLTEAAFEEVFPEYIPFIGFSVKNARAIYDELASGWIDSPQLKKFVVYLGQELKKRGAL